MATTIASVQLKEAGDVLPIAGVVTNMTVSVNQYSIIADATAGALLVNLPAASSVPGRVYVVKKGDASGNAVTITPNGADVVEGGATYIIANQDEAVTIQSDGIDAWHVISNNDTGAVAVSPWTTTAGVIHPVLLGNEVSVGTASTLGKFTVLGDTAAQITTVIRAAAAQAADIFVVEDNAGTDIFSVDTTGAVVTGKLTVTGAIDPTSILLSGGTALYFESNDGSTAPLSGAATGRIRYNNGTGFWQVSTQGGAYANIATGAGAATLQDAYDNGNTITTTTLDGVITFTRGATVLAAQGLLSLVDANASAARTASLFGVSDANSGTGDSLAVSRTAGTGRTGLFSRTVAGISVRSEVLAAGDTVWQSGLTTPSTTAAIFGDGDTVIGGSAMFATERFRVTGGDVLVDVSSTTAVRFTQAGFTAPMFVFDTTTASLGISEQTTTLVPNKNIQVVSQTKNADIELLSVGAAVASFYVGTRARGTVGALATVVNGDNLAVIDGRGHDGTSFSLQQAGVNLVSAGTWAVGSHPTRIEFYTTPSASTTLTERVAILEGGSMIVGTPFTPVGTNLLVVNGDAAITGKLTVTGALDPTSVLLSGGTALFFESNDGSTAPVSGAATGRIRYNNSTGFWQVSTQGGAYANIATGTSSSPWQTTAGVTNLVTSGDTVTIGSAVSGGKLFIDGDADEIQFQVQGTAGQTANLVTLENSAGTDLAFFNNLGYLTVGSVGTGVTGTTRIAAASPAGENDILSVLCENTTGGDASGARFVALGNATVALHMGLLNTAYAGADIFGFVGAGDTYLVSPVGDVVSEMVIENMAATAGMTFGGFGVQRGRFHDDISGGGFTFTNGAGVTTRLGLVSMIGTLDEITLAVRATAAQTADFFVVETSAGTDVFSVDSTGATVTGKLTVTGALDPTSVLLSGSTALFFESNDGSTATVSGAATGRIRYNNTTGTWQVSMQGGAYASIATGTGSGPWTTTAGVTHLVTSTENVSIGTSTAGGKLFVQGDADEIQLQIRSNSGGQTANLVQFQDTGATPIFNFTNSGTFLAGSDTSGALGTSSVRWGLMVSEAFNVFSTSGHANPIVQLARAGAVGMIRFGTGGASAVDTSLVRTAASSVTAADSSGTSDGTFRPISDGSGAVGTSAFRYGTVVGNRHQVFNTGEANPVVEIAASGPRGLVLFGAGGASAVDTSLHRPAAAVLTVADASGTSDGTFRPITDSNGAVGTNVFRYSSMVANTFSVFQTASDANPVVRLSNNAAIGLILFGTGGASALDSGLRRVAASSVAVTDSSGTSDGTFRPISDSGGALGTSSFRYGTVIANTHHVFNAAGDANPVVELRSSGTFGQIRFGAGAGSAVDVGFRRVAASQMTVTEASGTVTGDFVPLADNAGSVGTASLRWSLIRGVTVTSGDLNLEDPDMGTAWTLREAKVEGEDLEALYAINRTNGKKYKLVLEEVAG